MDARVRLAHDGSPVNPSLILFVKMTASAAGFSRGFVG